jgi:hypothetical protein
MIDCYLIEAYDHLDDDNISLMMDQTCISNTQNQYLVILYQQKENR